MGETDSVALVRAMIEATVQRSASAVLVHLVSDFSEEFPQSCARIAAANAVAAAWPIRTHRSS